MAQQTNTKVVAEFWARIEARDWDGVRDLLAEDVVFEWPHTRERLRGRDNVVDVNRAYPEGWSLEIRRIVGDDDLVVSEVRVPHRDLGTFWAASFFELRAGKIVRAAEYWVEEGFEQPPAWRRQWVERMEESQ